MGGSGLTTSIAGLGERLAYRHDELSLVLFLPFPSIVPSSVNGSNSSSKRLPYDVLARFIKAGDDHSSPLIALPFNCTEEFSVGADRGISGSGVGILDSSAASVSCAG